MSVAELVDSLSTHVPRSCSLGSRVIDVPDPVHWAVEMFRSYPLSTTLQIMKWAMDQGVVRQPGPPPPGAASASAKEQWDAFCLLDPNEPGAVGRFIDCVKSGVPVHGRLELFTGNAVSLGHWPQSEWALKFFEQQFGAALHRRHPLGFHAASTLWLSADQHVYPAHLDLQDGFLLHLAGRKLVRIWPTPEKYRDRPVFDYGDLEGRMASEPFEFDPEPGDVVFIPAGAVHQVNARGSEPAVSVSFHMGSPYPLSALCDQLNRLAGEECVLLPDHMQSTASKTAYFFQPSDYADSSPAHAGDIPEKLAAELLEVLQPKNSDRDQLRQLLSRWWKDSTGSKAYQTPYPANWR